MIYSNYKRPNIYKEALNTLTDESLHFAFGAVRSASTNRYKWIADYLFKNKNNILSNKHRMFIGFFSNKQMILSEYGNIEELQADTYMSVYFNGKEKTKLPEFIYELESGRYRAVGQQYAEYDEIEYTDPSGKFFSIDDLYGPSDTQSTTSYGSTTVSSAIVNAWIDTRIGNGTRINIGNYEYTILSKSTNGQQIELTSPIKENLGLYYNWNFSIFDILIGEHRYIPIFTDPLGNVVRDYRRVIEVRHRFGDSPIFVAAGYKFYDYTTDRDMFFWNNPPDWTEVNYNNAQIVFNDDDKDLYTHSYFLQKVSTQTAIFNGTVKIALIGIGSLISASAELESTTADITVRRSGIGALTPENPTLASTTGAMPVR